MKHIKLLASTAVVVTGAALSATTGSGVAASSKPSPGPIIHLKNPKAQFKVLPAQTHGNKPPSTPPQPGVNSVVNFTGSYKTPGFEPDGSKGSTWVTDTVGNPPSQGVTTHITAPIIPVIVQLLDINGAVAHTLDPTGNTTTGSPSNHDDNVAKALASPLYTNSTYTSSSTPTQFTDAVQRAEFASVANPNWHTVLDPVVEPTYTMKIPFPDWQWDDQDNLAVVSSWTFQNLLFPTTPTPDSTTPVGNAETTPAGNPEITPQDISTFLFQDIYLFGADPSQCCILGFHTVDVEAGPTPDTPSFYPVIYASYIGTQVFGSAFSDITGLSHEIAETYNDPFVAFDNVTDITPWWLAPNGNCQDDLETGDVVEGLPNATFPMQVGNMTYHPQNEALLQWFEQQTNSSALGGAFSYPDTTVLTHANTLQKPGCG